MPEQVTKTEKNAPHKTIAMRLRRSLPITQCRIVRFKVIQEADVSQKTYYRTINGQTSNLSVLMALAKVLKCSLDQVIDPNHLFENPNYDDPMSLEIQLGAFKESAA